MPDYPSLPVRPCTDDIRCTAREVASGGLRRSVGELQRQPERKEQWRNKGGGGGGAGGGGYAPPM